MFQTPLKSTYSSVQSPTKDSLITSPTRERQQYEIDIKLNNITETLPELLERLRQSDLLMKNQKTAKLAILQQIVEKLQNNIILERQQREEMFKRLNASIIQFNEKSAQSMIDIKQRFDEITIICKQTSDRISIIEKELGVKDRRVSALMNIYGMLQPITNEIALQIENSLRIAPERDAQFQRILNDQIEAYHHASTQFFGSMLLQISQVKADIEAFDATNRDFQYRTDTDFIQWTGDAEQKMDAEAQTRLDNATSIVKELDMLSKNSSDSLLIGNQSKQIKS
ncbi:MAG: hypothetical protein EZS28_023745 [Streblomastix strix]|uniref:Uncharacterized protein n=1 Tax=Streblomastix strix TaxID=222440 RepID=A0A5J4VDY5_9EUKA|nr:MAG: hypothetical protein EZS28_023745 [Streblomastix strix]